MSKRIEGYQTAPTDTTQSVLSVAEAAALLGVSKGLVYGFVRKGGVPALRLGRRILISRRALIDRLEDTP